MAALSVASLFGRRPFFELATHFRLQYALASTVCAAALAYARAWKSALLAVCCAALSWGYVIPYYYAAGGAGAQGAAGAGLLPTWPAQLPPFLRIPIDRCLVGEEVRVYSVRTGPQTGSDHLPLVVELGLPVQP